MPKWTDAQKNAIDARDCNVLVSAAAGSGKTAVLVERVIKLLTDSSAPIDADKLLIVTFTNAAAAEMKNRIMSSLNALIAENPNDTNAIRQLSLLPSAKICTIDSFCINLVRENFFNIDIQQDFRVLDDSEEQIIEQTAIDTVVEQLYEENREEFKSLVEMLSTTKSDKGLTDCVRRISRYITAQPFPNDWLGTAAELYNPDISLDNSFWKKYVCDDIFSTVDYIEKLICDCKGSLTPDDELFDKYSSMLDDDLGQIVSVKNSLSGDWDTLCQCVNSIKFRIMPSKRGYVSPSKEIISAARGRYKDLIKKNILPYFNSISSEYREDCEKLYPVIKLLVEVVQMYNNEMMQIKKEMNAYSFSDIEHFAIELLFYKNDSGEIIRTDLAKEYEDNFDYILVDEYQDTNRAQDTLFEMLSNGRNRFMVGDVKQSIYRFRLAMPGIFNEKKKLFKSYDKASDNVNQKIILDKNFRSRKGICDYTNFLFSILMNEQVGELDYNTDEFLNYGADYPDTDVPCAQVKIIECPEDEDTTEYEARQAAQLILKKIKAKEQIKDGDTTRDIKFGDIAVLFRAAKSKMPVFARVFSEYSIPVTANNKTNLFENNEVSMLISLLRTIDNPSKDIPLLATLMSPFYGYTADDIASARVKTKSSNLYTAVSNDGEKFSAFLNDLEKYRKYACSMSVASFIRQLIADTSFFAVISAMGNAEQRRLNVLKIVDMAAAFDNGDTVGLTSFIRYVDRIIDSGSNVESASLTQSGSDSVQLMSIHQSKGLEFPVCIFAGAGSKYNNTDLNNLVQLHPEKGIGLKVHNEQGLYRYDSLQYTCIRNMNKISSMSENLRVLYVAVTRAKEQFISLITVNDIEKKCAKLSDKVFNSSLSPAESRDITGDGDFLLICAMLHRDGARLRSYANKYIEPLTSDFDLSVDILNEEQESSEVQDNAYLIDENIIDKIDSILSFKYDRCELSHFASKRTASSLDEKEQGYEFFASSKPAFLNKSGMTAAQKGTAMHTFMQFCDYTAAKSDLTAEIQRLTNSGYITEKQAQSLDKDRLNAFFNGDFAKRMFDSRQIYRELKVSSFVPANELEDTDYTDKVLVQGIADCVFEEQDGLVLVDYKTDRVSNQQELLDRYKNQVAFYRYAVSKTLDKPVKEAVLYSFYLQKVCFYNFL